MNICFFAIVAMAAASAILLAACAGSPRMSDIGQPRAAVVERLGTPTGTYPIPGGGERLQYSRQPNGAQVYNLDFSADGRLAKIDQSLDPDNLTRIGIDSWTTKDVLFNFGKPALVERVWSFEGDIWTYNYLDFQGPWTLHVHIDRAGVVRKVVRLVVVINPMPDE